MLERLSAPILDTARAPASLFRRRMLFFALVTSTIIGVLWLAGLAVAPNRVSAFVFLAAFAVTLPWTVVGFWNATIGFLLMAGARDPLGAVNPMAARIRGDEPVFARTAILMCVRNEAPAQVARNLRPLVEGLEAARVADRFRIYLLSDSTDPEVIVGEEACFAAFAASHGAAVAITYRR